MGIGRAVAATAAGLGLVGIGYTGLGGQDETSRDEVGAIVDDGELGAFRIRLGDCIRSSLGTTVESVQGVPCSEPHQLETYHAFNLPEGDGSYPGDSAVGELADQGCFNAFEPFVARSYQESVYDYTALTPTQGSWDELDDREVLCFIGNYDETEKTGSAHRTGR